MTPSEQFNMGFLQNKDIEYIFKIKPRDWLYLTVLHKWTYEKKGKLMYFCFNRSSLMFS